MGERRRELVRRAVNRCEVNIGASADRRPDHSPRIHIIYLHSNGEWMPICGAVITEVIDHASVHDPARWVTCARCDPYVDYAQQLMETPDV